MSSSKSSTSKATSSWKSMPFSKDTQWSEINQLRFSPSGEYAMSAEQWGDEIIFRFVDVNTGKLRMYDLSDDCTGLLMDAYFVSEYKIATVLLMQEDGCHKINVRNFEVDHDWKDITFISENNVLTNVSASVPVDAARDRWNKGVTKMTIQKKDFAAVMFRDNLLLFPWDSSVHDTAVGLTLALKEFREFQINKVPMVCGSKLYFPLSTITNPHESSFYFDTQHLDKLLCLDLAHIELEESDHWIGEDFPFMSLVDLEKLHPFTSKSTKNLDFFQVDNYFVAYEKTLMSRSRTKKNVFITDLENMTVQRMKAAYNPSSFLTIQRDSLMIFKNAYRSRNSFIDFKIFTIPGKIPTLHELVARHIRMTDYPIDEDIRHFINYLLL